MPTVIPDEAVSHEVRPLTRIGQRSRRGVVSTHELFAPMERGFKGFTIMRHADPISITPHAIAYTCQAEYREFFGQTYDGYMISDPKWKVAAEQAIDHEVYEERRVTNMADVLGEDLTENETGDGE